MFLPSNPTSASRWAVLALLPLLASTGRAGPPGDEVRASGAGPAQVLAEETSDVTSVAAVESAASADTDSANADNVATGSAATAGGDTVNAGAANSNSAPTAVAIAHGTADTPAFLAALGIHATTGAAAGYVDDRLCADCHGSIARSFAEVGMARSFYRPSRAAAVERFDETFEHPPSGQRFAMTWRGEQLWFRRWQVDTAGRPVHVLEQGVDWVLGSGNHSRTYLYRTPSGELWQLPIAWYTQEEDWGMAPGFDRPDHEGVLRSVQRECLACHDAFPEVPAGSDRFGMPHRFPEQLPQGIGCQRCHGPGAEHVRRARDPGTPFETVTDAVVNPARLSPDRLRDVCQQCHLQPAVALPAVRRFARGDYSFRPGEALAAHRVELEAVEEGRPPGDRFEINHHAYQLEQSRCFSASGGALSCLTCHDPHRVVPKELRADHYRAACLTCHQVEQCRGPGGGHGAQKRAGVEPLAAHGTAAARAGTGPGDPLREPGKGVSPDLGDCAGCHMPKRRTEDVVHVVMTDHQIARGPFGPELLAPRREADPILAEARFLRPSEAPTGAEGEIYRAVGVARIGIRADAVPFLEQRLAAGVADPSSPAGEVAAAQEPWLRLAEGQLLMGRYAAAEASLERALERGPTGGLARVWQGLAAAGQGRREEALARTREATVVDPDLAEAHFNLGRLLLAWGDPAAAIAPLERALALRPNLPAAWLRRGEAREALGRRAEAIADYRQAIAVDPGLTAAHLALVGALVAAGEEPAAREARALGVRYARQPEALAGAAEADAGQTPEP